MRLYVIGPVSGMPDNNKQAFIDAYDRLLFNGYSVLIPHDFVSENADWPTAMKRSLETMFKCDGVAMLEGCDKSHGARLEYAIATALGMPCLSVQQWASGLHKAIGIEDMKECPRCKRVLPVSLFSSSNQKSDGHQSYCRDCMKSYKQCQLLR